MQKINPPSIYPPYENAYAQIVIAPAGSIAFLSGMVALDVDGSLVGVGDYRAQARKCFANIQAAIDAIGASPDRLVKMTMNVVDYRPELAELIFAAGLDVFGTDWPIAASMMLGVEALARPEWLIEIDAIVSVAD